MNSYKFIAKDINGTNIKGKEAASDTSELIIILRNKGLYLMNYKLIKQREKFNTIFNRIFCRRLALKDLSYLCKQFSVILSAGISIAEAIEILQEESIDNNLKSSLARIKSMIYNGDSLSNSMKQLGKVFPLFMIKMVAVGEESGKLDIILMKLSIYYEKQNKMRSKTINALIYPSVVFIVSIAIMLFLMIKVVPIFADNLLSSGGELPGITVFVLAISDFLTREYSLIFLVLVLIIIASAGVRDKYFYRIKKDRVKLNLPVLKKIYLKLICSKFADAFSMLIGSGISVVKSLDIVAQLLDNIIIEENLQAGILKVNNGESLSSVIKDMKIFPKLLCSMIKIGEETGCIEELLHKVSEIFEEEAYESISKVTVLIEPVMICFLSVMVAFIIGATMLPMLNMMKVMGS